MRRSGLRLPWIKFGPVFTKLYYVYDLLLILIAFYQFLFSAGSIMRIKNFQDRCTLGIVTAVLATGIMISIFYILFGLRIQEFMDNWKELNQRILNSDLEEKEQFRQMYLNLSDHNETFSKRILFIAFWTPFVYCSPVPVIDLIQDSYRTHLPLPILYPYDDHLPGVYELTFCLHVAGLLISVMKKIGNDCFFLAMFNVHSAYIRFLTDTIKNMGEQFNHNGDEFIKRKLILWIKYHNDIIRSANNLVTIYSPIIVIYYGNLIIIVVFGLFTQIKNDRDNIIQGFGVGGFCLINIFQLYMISSSAEDLASQANELTLELYNIPWYQLNKTNSDAFRLILLLSKHPVKVTAYRAPTFLLNKETFIGFIKNTITALMTFSKMNDHVNQPNI